MSSGGRRRSIDYAVDHWPPPSLVTRSGMPPTVRSLGTSGLSVSRLALGSWRTFERMTPEAGVAVMRAAREAGINFLDDARYDDETGTAPIPTGYSEVRFGELFRAAGWPRAETVVANKLWWEFWPQQSAAEELDASLARMQFDSVDVIYANPPPAGLDLDTMVRDVGGLVDSGRARAWAIVNWPADQAARGVARCEARGRAAAVRGAAAVQPRAALVGRGSGDEARARRLRCARGRVVRAGRRRAHGQVRPRSESGSGGRSAGRAALRERHSRRTGARGDGERARHHTGCARDRVRAREPERGECAVRRDESRSRSGTTPPRSTSSSDSTTSSGPGCTPSARRTPDSVSRSRTTSPTPRNRSTSSSPTGSPDTSGFVVDRCDAQGVDGHLDVTESLIAGTGFLFAAGRGRHRRLLLRDGRAVPHARASARSRPSSSRPTSSARRAPASGSSAARRRATPAAPRRCGTPGSTTPRRAAPWRCSVARRWCCSRRRDLMPARPIGRSSMTVGDIRLTLLPDGYHRCDPIRTFVGSTVGRLGRAPPSARRARPRDDDDGRAAGRAPERRTRADRRGLRPAHADPRRAGHGVLGRSPAREPRGHRADAERHRRRRLQPPARRPRRLDDRPHTRGIDLRTGASPDGVRRMGLLVRRRTARRSGPGRHRGAAPARRAPRRRRGTWRPESASSRRRATRRDTARCWCRRAQNARSCSATRSTARSRSRIPSGRSPPTSTARRRCRPARRCCASSTRRTRRSSVRTSPTRCSAGCSADRSPGGSRSTSAPAPPVQALAPEAPPGEVFLPPLS